MADDGVQVGGKRGCTWRITISCSLKANGEFCPSFSYGLKLISHSDHSHLGQSIQILKQVS
jgi:hypothetical protein